MKKLLSLFFLLVNCSLYAEGLDSLKMQADSAYAREDYIQAAQLYHQAQPSAAVYYNLGNTYYRMDELAKAILYYERALLLSPGDKDIRFNLDMARSKTIDKVVPIRVFFFVEWYRSLVNFMSADTWGKLALMAFVVALVGLGGFFSFQVLPARKAGFAVFFIFLALSVCANVAGWYQRKRLEYRTGAIVTSASTIVRSTPSDSGQELFVLHEGTRVEIKDDGLKLWCEVELADGKRGWMLSKDLELI